MYANAKTLACSIGNGIERGKSGGSGLRSIMSVSVLLGQLGRRGAGIFAKSGLAIPTTPDKLQRPDLIPSGTRTLNIVDIGRHLLNDGLQALAIIDSRGLGKLFLTYHHLNRQKIRLSIVGPRPLVREMLEFVNFPKLVPIYDSMEDVAMQE